MTKLTDDEKKYLIKKLSIIKALSIVSLCIIPLIIIITIVIIITSITTTGFLNPFLMLIPTFFFSIISTLNLVLGIIILATDWKNEEINNNKILWGILTLVLLGPISSLIFSIQSINIYKNINDILNDVEKYEKQKTQYDKKSNNDKEDNLENNKDE